MPTTIENPVYHVDGVLHYAVDHTPAIFYQTFSRDNSLTIIPYLNEFVNCSIGEVLTNCVVIRDGVIVDENINLYQNR